MSTRMTAGYCGLATDDSGDTNHTKHLCNETHWLIIDGLAFICFDGLVFPYLLILAYQLLTLADKGVSMNSALAKTNAQLQDSHP